VNQGAASDDLNLALDFGYQHTPKLRSFYDYSFAYYGTDGAESLNNRVRAGVEHQLYESLTSTLDVHASQANSDSGGSTLDQMGAGTAGSVDYSKRLGGWGHLSISDSAGYDFTHQDSTGGELFINSESHTVPLNGLFFLDQPRDLSVVRITDSTGAITLVEGVAGDYEVITSSDPWQIQIHTSGPNHIAAGSTVKVDYTILPNPTGSYSTLNNQFQVRLDFWEQRAGIYARYNSTDNQADSSQFVLENVREFQAGADFAWSGFRADANYTDRNSSLYNYTSITLSEGYACKAGLHSSVGIDFRQQWSQYPGGVGTNMTADTSFYSATARYEWHPAGQFSWSSEAGYERLRGAGNDQNLIVARTYLTWFVGKLDFRLGYEYQDQKYTTETRERHFVFLRARRNF
jgi:hypothetical protein